ncbi:MAG: hypothetical protein AAFV69_04065 [Pseudomonadota bacterium]
MNRREFIKTGSVAAATVSGATVAGAQSMVRPNGNEVALNVGPETSTTPDILLRVSAPWADDLTGQGDLSRRVLNRITTLSSGRIQFEILAPSHDEQPTDVAFGSECEQIAAHPAFAYFSEVPGNNGLNASSLKGWLETAGGQALWEDLARAHGYHPLACGHLGANPPLWSVEPISSMTELRDRRIAVSGLSASVAKGMGAVPVTTQAALAEPGTALATGDADLVDAGGLYFAMQSGVHKSARSVTTTGLSQTGKTITMRIAVSAWDRLNHADQAIFASASSELFTTSATEAHMQQKMIQKALETHHNIMFQPLDASMLTSIEQVSRAVIAHTASFDKTSRRIDASFMSFRALSS